MASKKKKGTLQQKYKPREFSAETTQSAIQKPTLWLWEVTRLTHLSTSWTGKQMNHKTCLEIIMILVFVGVGLLLFSLSLPLFFVVVFFLFFFLCLKFRHTKYTQIIQVNRSVQEDEFHRFMPHSLHSAHMQWWFGDCHCSQCVQWSQGRSLPSTDAAWQSPVWCRVGEESSYWPGPALYSDRQGQHDLS